MRVHHTIVRKIVEVSLRINKDVVFRCIAICGGLLAGLLLLEILVRVFIDSSWFVPRASVSHDPYYMLCYPTDPFNHFPIDLRKSNDSKMVGRCLQIADLVDRLQRQTPYCVLTNTSEDSPRVVTGPRSAKENILLIGDSFAFGEGVTDNQTFGYYLSEQLGARVVNAGVPGADVAEVNHVLRRALHYAGHYHFTQVIYLFVLNDPLLPSELMQRQRFLNNLINIRMQGLRNLNLAMRVLWRASHWSRTANAIMRVYMLRYVTADTIAWYQDIFNPVKNPLLADTFKMIGAMKQQADEKGVGFTLVIYPLLFDLDHYPLREQHALIRREASAQGVNTIDLLTTFSAHSHDDLIVHPIDLHPSGQAHYLAAEAVAKAFKSP
jgi:hypothetical protein